MTQDQITELKDFVHREISRSELKMTQQMQQLREQLREPIREPIRESIREPIRESIRESIREPLQEQLQIIELNMTQQFQAGKDEMVRWVVGLFIGSIIVVSSGLGVYTSVLMNM